MKVRPPPRSTTEARPQVELKPILQPAESHTMLYAVQTPPDPTVIEVPANLDDLDGLLALRAEIEETIAGTGDEVVLDCTRLAQLPNPVIGWLVNIAARLDDADRRLVFRDASAELCLRFRTLGGELRGARFERGCATTSY